MESKIGYTRRNLFVPIPEFDDIQTYNRQLLDRHGVKADERHYKKLLPIKRLFLTDQAALMPLPRAPFDVCRYEYVQADGYGKVRIDARHHYSSRPEYGGREVLVGIRAHTIDILDENNQVLVRHARQYGAQRSDTCDHQTSLAVLLNNPGAGKNSGVRELVSETLREVMDNQQRDQLRAILRTLHQLTTAYSFETALRALEEGLRINRIGFCDTAVPAARISGYGLNTEPEKGQDLGVYDQLLLEEQRS